MRSTGGEWLNLELAYGHKALPVRLPAGRVQAVIEPPAGGEAAREADLAAAALAAPIGSRPLRAVARAGQKVAIVTSDLTRPCPSGRLLPPILDELAAAGVADADITVVLALGLHRPMAEAEIAAAVGSEVVRRVRVLNHNPNDTVRLGVTSFGTPVELYRPVVEADLRVCLGNLELHYFAGYSGGAKAILPGCASRATVNANHAMMVRPEAAAGRLDGNPVRADLEEGAAMAGLTFILNVVVDGQHRIVGAVAGDAVAGHRVGCQMVAERGIVPIGARADIVLVSAGGAPKDLNLYQAQKALDNAAYGVQDGGVVILVAECPEGLGNPTFETWLAGGNTPDEILARIQQEFVLGGHKAAAVAAVLKRAAVYLVSALPEELVRRCGLAPFATVDAALDAARAAQGDGASILVLPQGGSVLPLLQAPMQTEGGHMGERGTSAIWYPGHELLLDDIVRAENCSLYDAAGRRYVDLESGVWCTSIGHGHPRIQRVMAEQAARIGHTGFCYSSRIVEEARREVLALLGFEGGTCVFLCSGSEAVEFGVRSAQGVIGAPLLLTMAESYFGAYGSASKRSQEEWFSFDWTVCASCPTGETCGPQCAQWAAIPWARIGGLLLEPGSGGGVVRFPPLKLVASLVHTVRANGGLVLVNEVTTGIGRTGTWFGYQHYGFTPDIVALGKGVGNGYPVSVAAFAPAVADRLRDRPLKYSQSHQNDPLGAAIAREVIRVIREEGLIERGRELGAQLLRGLEGVRERTGQIREIRARGLMLAIELKDDPAASRTIQAHRALVRRGFVVGRRPGTNVLRLDPSLTIEPQDLEGFVVALEEILAGQG